MCYLRKIKKEIFTCKFFCLAVSVVGRDNIWETSMLEKIEHQRHLMVRLGSQMTDAWEAEQQGNLRVQTADAQQGRRSHLREHLPFFMHLLNFWTIIFLYVRACEEEKPKPGTQEGEVLCFLFGTSSLVALLKSSV